MAFLIWIFHFPIALLSVVGAQASDSDTTLTPASTAAWWQTPYRGENLNKTGNNTVSQFPTPLIAHIDSLIDSAMTTVYGSMSIVGSRVHR